MSGPRYKPEELQLIQSAIAPGDPQPELFRYIIPGVTSGLGTLVLSDRTLYLVICGRDWRGTWHLKYNATIPLASVSAIETHVKQKIFSCTFWWEGKQQKFTAFDANEGAKFVERLRHVVMTSQTAAQTVGSSTSIADEI